MFRWCWWNRSPYTLLNCWPILIFVNLYFIVKITHLMDAEAGRTGAKRVRNAPVGAGDGRVAPDADGFGLAWVRWVRRVRLRMAQVMYFVFSRVPRSSAVAGTRRRVPSCYGDGPSAIGRSLMRKLNKPPGKAQRRKPKAPYDPYGELLSGVVELIEQARLAAVRSVNVVLTSTYWLVGQR